MFGKKPPGLRPPPKDLPAPPRELPPPPWANQSKSKGHRKRSGAATVGVAILGIGAIGIMFMYGKSSATHTNNNIMATKPCSTGNCGRVCATCTDDCPKAGGI